MEAPQDHRSWWDIWGKVAGALTSLIGLATAALGLWKARGAAEHREKKLHLRRKKNRFVRCVLKLVKRE